MEHCALGDVTVVARFDYDDARYAELLNGVETISREAGPSNPFVFLPWWTFFLVPLLEVHSEIFLQQLLYSLYM